jgi:transposase
MTKNSASTNLTIGIDLASDKADLCAITAEEKVHLQLTCPQKDYAKLVRRLKKLDPALIVLEPTGGYEKDLLARLFAAGLPVRVVHANHARAFASALGQLAKTDRVDARMLALYALRNHLTPQTAPSEQTLKIRELCNRRLQLVAIRAEEKTRAGKKPRLRETKVSLDEHLDYLDDAIEEIDQHLDAFVAGDENFARQEKLLTSVPGVGDATARMLLATMPELGQLNRGETAALAGLAPFNCESGHSRKRQMIRGGRKRTRNALYLAALSARTHNPKIKAFFEKLRGRGKTFKVAITACMRKLLVILNTLLKKGENFDRQRGVATVAPTLALATT